MKLCHLKTSGFNYPKSGTKKNEDGLFLIIMAGVGVVCWLRVWAKTPTPSTVWKFIYCHTNYAVTHYCIPKLFHCNNSRPDDYREEKTAQAE